MTTLRLILFPKAIKHCKWKSCLCVCVCLCAWTFVLMHAYLSICTSVCECVNLYNPYMYSIVYIWTSTIIVWLCMYQCVCVCKTRLIGKRGFDQSFCVSLYTLKHVIQFNLRIPKTITRQILKNASSVHKSALFLQLVPGFFIQFNFCLYKSEPFFNFWKLI